MGAGEIKAAKTEFFTLAVSFHCEHFSLNQTRVLRSLVPHTSTTRPAGTNCISGVSSMETAALHFTSMHLTNHKITLIYVFLAFELKKQQKK